MDMDQTSVPDQGPASGCCEHPSGVVGRAYADAGHGRRHPDPDLADSVDAANAFAQGAIEYLDEPTELPPPPEAEPMVMRGVRLPGQP
jgi:hypothetical protein